MGGKTRASPSPLHQAQTTICGARCTLCSTKYTISNNITNEISSTTSASVSRRLIPPRFSASQLGGIPVIGAPLQTLAKPLLAFGRKALFMIGWQPDDGALTQVYLATSPDVATRDIRGKFYVPSQYLLSFPLPHLFPFHLIHLLMP